MNVCHLRIFKCYRSRRFKESFSALARAIRRSSERGFSLRPVQQILLPRSNSAALRVGVFDRLQSQESNGFLR